MILESPWGEMTKKISNEELNMRIKTTRVSDTILMKNAIGLAMPYKIQNSKIYTTALICHPEGRKKVGRPKTTWLRTTEQERSQLGWNSWTSARAAAKGQEEAVFPGRLGEVRRGYFNSVSLFISSVYSTIIKIP